MIAFTLYSRSYCHLCDDMLAELQTLQGEYAFSVAVVDVDAEEALAAQYDELVPVLMGSKDGTVPQRLCHYHLDEASVRAFLDMEALA